jgi:hypothetical protein
MFEVKIGPPVVSDDGVLVAGRGEDRWHRDGRMTDAPDPRTRSLLVAALAEGGPGLPAANQLCLACVGLFRVDGAAVSVVHEGASRGTFGSSNAASRRLDEYQFTFGEGPCLDAVKERSAILVPDLDAPGEARWPAFADAVVNDGIRGVFALPITIASVCVGALDLFRELPGPLAAADLAGARLAAELASLALFDSLAPSDDGLVDTGSDLADGQLREIDRVEVHQATGMLIAQLDVDAAEALVRLRAHAIATGQTASEVAWAIIRRTLVLERDDRHTTGRTEL